jgi:hypothetical protein
MRTRKFKQPNAQIHGAFAETTILPGEDPREFDELLSALVEEWTPVGPTEEDAVLTIAKCKWRKRRVQLFFQAELLKKSVDPNHPAYNETLGVLAFAAFVANDPETAFEKYASRCLTKDKIEYLKGKFRLCDFESTSEWTEAITKELTSDLLRASRIPSELADKAALLRSSLALSPDLIEQELALEERLDAMIDRAIKRLVHTKMMKQMMGQVSAEQADDLTGVRNSKPSRLGKTVN